MEKTKHTLSYIGGFFLFLLVIGLGIKSTITSPDYAVVYLLPETKTYISPACLSSDEIAILTQSTEGQAKKLGYSPDRECVDGYGFSQEGRSLTGMLFEKVRIFGPLSSRWNKDGTWNW